MSVGATPSESGSGYIREMDIYYALQNVGRRAGNDRYISVLRLVSLEHSYDVIIPYCVSDLCYDSLKQQFVCVLSDLTRPSEGYPGMSIIPENMRGWLILLFRTIPHLNNSRFGRK